MIYKVLVGHTSEELSQQVNLHLLDDWKLVGGLAMGIASAVSEGVIVDSKNKLLLTATQYGNTLLFCQAVEK